MSIGDNIKKARKNAGLTQKQLGERLGVTFQSIAQWETGRRTPKQETVKKIATALDVPWYELVPDVTIYVNPDSLHKKTEEDEKKQREIAKAVNEFSEWMKREKTRREIPLVMSDSFLHEQKTISLLYAFNQLNEIGKQNAVDYTNDLGLIEKYQRTDTMQDWKPINYPSSEEKTTEDKKKDKPKE